MMPRSITVTLLFISLLASVPGMAADLPASVQQVISGHKVSADAFGIVVQEVGADKPLLSVNAGAGFNPASTIKLLTTWLALEAE